VKGTDKSAPDLPESRPGLLAGGRHVSGQKITKARGQAAATRSPRGTATRWQRLGQCAGRWAVRLATQPACRGDEQEHVQRVGEPVGVSLRATSG
jgi:hypothetical protein